MAGQLLVFQARVSAAPAGRPREIIDRADQDQPGQRIGHLDGRDRPANPDAHWFHVRYDQFGSKPSGGLPQSVHTTNTAYHFELGLVMKEILDDARKRWRADYQDRGFAQMSP